MGVGAGAGEPETLRADGATRWTPTWSPDGRRIAYEKSENGITGIYALDLTTGEERSLTSGEARAVAPTWSPAGHLIAFQAMREGRYAIVGVAPDGRSKPRMLAQVDGHAVTPAWSADGALVFACHFTGEESPGLCTAGADGRPANRLMGGRGKFFAPDVAADGRLVFMHRDGGGWRIRVSDPSGRSLVSLPLPLTPLRTNERAWPLDGSMDRLPGRRERTRMAAGLLIPQLSPNAPSRFSIQPDTALPRKENPMHSRLAARALLRRRVPRAEPRFLHIRQLSYTMARP